MAVASLVLLSPLAALAALAAVLPLAAATAVLVRGRRAAARLGLEPGGSRALVPRAAAAVSICVLLGLAAGQPVLQTRSSSRVRTGSQVLFVVDVSRSMLATSRPGAPTRLDRAKTIVSRLRLSVPDVPAGLAGLTDRVLPYVFPTADGATFDDVLRRSVAIEAPPPEKVDRNATSFGALASISRSNLLSTSAAHRTCVLVTDGESAPYSVASAAGSLAAPHGCSLLVVQVWNAGERVYRADGTPEAAYRPDAAAPSTVRLLAEATGGRAFGADRTAAAERDLKRLAEVGPAGRATLVERTRRLAPLLAALALAVALGLAASAVPGILRVAPRRDYAHPMHTEDRAA